MPLMLGICGQHSLRDDAALTHFRGANRLATVRWGLARESMRKAQNYFLQKGERELPFVDRTWQELNAADSKKAVVFLNGYTADFFASTVMKWDELYKTYWRRFWAGF